VYGILREAVFNKYETYNACGEHLGHETISWEMWWVCWRPWSVRARPKRKSNRNPTFFDCPMGHAPQRQSSKYPTGSTLSGSNAPRKYPMKQNITTQLRDMGQGMMTGSNTPWAQGPANLLHPIAPRIPPGQDMKSELRSART